MDVEELYNTIKHCLIAKIEGLTVGYLGEEEDVKEYEGLKVGESILEEDLQEWYDDVTEETRKKYHREGLMSTPDDVDDVYTIKLVLKDDGWQRPWDDFSLPFNVILKYKLYFIDNNGLIY